MSVDFYLYRGEDMDRIAEIDSMKALLRETHPLIATKDFLKDMERLVYSYLSPIHIGHATPGWKFCFNTHNWEYFTDRISLELFLMNGIIRNEFNKTININDFWRLVETYQTGYTDESYMKDRFGDRYDNASINDQVLDGLRFSSHYGQ